MAFRNLFRKTFRVSNRVLVEDFLLTLLCYTLLPLFDRIVPSGEVEAFENLNECTNLLNNVTIERYFERRKYWLTSNLGSILFQNQPLKYKQQNRTFNVLLWNHTWWPIQEPDPLSMCSVNNCVFSGDDTLINIVDAVIVPTYSAQFPEVRDRNTSQRWVFLCNESPINRFAAATPGTINTTSVIESMANIYNWSMTYRSDSDVPTPYGRTVALPEVLMEKMTGSITKDIIPFWKHKQRDVLVAAMISNCNVHERNQYVNELQKYIKVDLFGNCSRTQGVKGCPMAPADCPKLGNYLFFLAFENSGCRQYITEKLFHNAFAKGAIPVVMGAPVADCEKLLPPNSFLHVNSFNSPRELAMEILNLGTNDDYLVSYHKWRHTFEIVNEHGYFGRTSYELCRLCEALNYNDNETKVYDLDALRLYLDPKLLCITPVKPTPTTPVKIRMKN